jgi:hypothetical protein
MDKESARLEDCLESVYNVENDVKLKMNEIIKYFDEQIILDDQPLTNLAIEKLEKLPDYKSKRDVALDLKLSFDIYMNDKTTIIFIGDTCSGKTTMLNCLLASILSSSREEDWDKYRLLSESNQENTYMMTFIENSYDNKFHVELYVNKIIKKSYDYNNDDEGIKELQNLLYDFDDYAIEAISKRKKDQIFDDTRESLNRSSIIGVRDLPLLKIYIPSKTMKFRFIDSPGLSNEEFIEYFLSYTDIFISCIFVLVKGLDDPQAINTNLLKPLNILSSKFQNSVFYIAFTKYDKLYEDLKGTRYNHETKRTLNDKVRNAQQKQRSLHTFIKTMSQNLTNLKFKDIFILCPKLSLDNEANSEYRNEILNFIKEITNVDNLHFNKQKIIKFKNIVLSILNKYNTVKEKEFIFSKEEVVLIEKAVEESKGEFTCNIEIEFLKKFPSTLDNFRTKYSEWYTTIREEIKNIDTQILTGNYYNPNKYAQDLIVQLEPVVVNLFRNDVNHMVSNQIKKFIEKLNDNIKKKLITITNTFNPNQIHVESYKQFSLSEKVFIALSTLAGIGTIAIGSLARFGFGFAISVSGVGNAILAAIGLSAVPGIGWIIGGSLFIGSVVYVAYKQKEKKIVKEDYHEKCIEFIIKNIYEQKEKIRNNIVSKYNEVLDNLLEIAKNQKQISQEIMDLISILNSIQSPEFSISVDHLSKIFLESIRKQKTIPKGLRQFWEEIADLDYI